ncbi:MAG: class putative F420-dependent enzyme [Nocardioidaceae bacterium]|nr:class putative F420-dependent enzyme [Nocardioidaceae bacterium]
MPTMTKPDAKVQALLDAPNMAVMSTLDAHGAPRSHPLWFNVEGDHVCLNSVRGRAWPRRVENDERIALCVVNHEATHEYVEITGRVTEVTHDGADAHIDALSNRYIGIDYPNRFEGEERLKVTVVPEKFVYVNLLEAIPAAPFGDQRD